MRCSFLSQDILMANRLLYTYVSLSVIDRFDIIAKKTMYVHSLGVYGTKSHTVRFKNSDRIHTIYRLIKSEQFCVIQQPF